MGQRRYFGPASKPKRPDGFRSGSEARLAGELKDLGVPYEFETTHIEYTTSHTYTPDFVVLNDAGERVVLEVKGYWDSQDRRKILTVVEGNPGLNLWMIFDNSNKPIRKGSPTSYADWCDKKGIKYLCRKAWDFVEDLKQILRGT